MSTTTFHYNRNTADTALALVRAFAAEHGEALCNASLLLGGPAAERRCLRLLARLRASDALAPPDVPDLIGMHRLLMLEHVGDPDREETARFAEIDPEDPRVHDLCLLADRLRDLLEALAEQDDKTAAAMRSAVAGLAA